MKIIVDKVLIFIIFFISFSSAETLLINEKESYSVLQYYEYSAVKELNENVENLNEHQWYKHKDELNLSTNSKAYWIRLSVRNTSDKFREFYFMEERSFVYSMEYYVLKSKELITQGKSGFHTQHHTPFNATHRLFPLSLSSGSEVEIFFKVQNYNMMDIPFKLVSNQYITNYYQSYNLFQGIFFGIIFLMSSYSLILYFFTKFKPYFYNFTYSSFLMLYIATYFGFFHRYVDISSIFIHLLRLVGAVGFVLSVVLFIKELFVLEKSLPLLNKFLNFMIIYILVIYMIYSMVTYFDNFYYSELTFNLLIGFMPIYVAVVLFSLYYLAITQKNFLALWYTIAWSIISFVGLLLMAKYKGMIEDSYGIDYIFEGFMIFESFLFTILLSLREREIKEVKKVEEKLKVEKNKLVAMENVIGSITHQWRQPLSKINGVLLGLDIDYKKNVLNDEKFEQYLDNIERLTAYLSQTIDDFTNMSKSEQDPEWFFLSDVIESSKSLVTASFSDSLHPMCQECTRVNCQMQIYGSKSELLQGFLIVFNNALDACEENNIEAQIKISTFLDAESIVIQIEDNGGGIEETNLDQIYNPYFTTKQASNGTGVGLYILKNIIEKNMKGSVKIENGDEGVICTLSIPLVIIK